jgi:pimeloyl-ACP methyl ester carboxylesterase
MAEPPLRHPCRADPRFSFALLAPPAPARRLLVVVHDSDRRWAELAETFADWARARAVALLAPLFPAGVLGDGNPDGYKFLHEGDVRHDLLLEDMVDDALARTRCTQRRLLLHGYSGGAQFAHRYALLHPGRLQAVVVGAPGEVTLLDAERPWWGGVADTRERFGLAVNAAALRRVVFHLLVGERDTDTDALRPQPPSRFWPAGTRPEASNRIERLRTFDRSMSAAGVPTHFALMPGATHEAGLRESARRAQAVFDGLDGAP